MNEKPSVLQIISIGFLIVGNLIGAGHYCHPQSQNRDAEDAGDYHAVLVCPVL